jgi:Cys-rich repeat protein
MMCDYFENICVPGNCRSDRDCATGEFCDYVDDTEEIGLCTETYS